MKKLEMNPELSNTTQIPTATAQVPVLGFIFNRADPKKVNSHSNYYYYYEDGAPRSSHRANGKKKRI